MSVSVIKSAALIAAFVTISIAPQAVVVGQTQAAEPAKDQQVDAEKLLAEFSKTYDESKWEKDFRGTNHIRVTGDAGFKVRAETLKQLVAGGKASIPALEKYLTDGDAPTRILGGTSDRLPRTVGQH